MDHSNLTAAQRKAWARYHRNAMVNDKLWQTLKENWIAAPDGIGKEAIGDAMDDLEDYLYDAAWEAFQTSDELKEAGVDEETLYQTKRI